MPGTLNKYNYGTHLQNRILLLDISFNYSLNSLRINGEDSKGLVVLIRNFCSKRTLLIILTIIPVTFINTLYCTYKNKYKKQLYNEWQSGLFSKRDFFQPARMYNTINKVNTKVHLSKIIHTYIRTTHALSPKG
jgi:hypothetical protein